MDENSGLLIKKNEKSSKKYGKEPYDRTIEELFETGVIILDKHSGPTSHQEVDNLKKVLKIDKAGHSGTLDPKVTGVLLIGLGRATRLMEYMLKSNKEYVCLMYLHKEVSKETIEKTMKKFTGTIIQTPPIVSAVVRRARERKIYSIELLDIKDEGKSVLFRVACQHGTYIRKLCTDMAEAMGIKGQMKELRRTKAGPFSEDDGIISIDKLRNLLELWNESKGNEKEVLDKELRKYFRPMEEALKDFKKVYLRDSAVDSVSRGGDLAIPGVSMLEDKIEMGEEVALMTLKGELVGMGIAFLSSKDVMKKKKGAFVKTNKVFMDPQVYPRHWAFDNKDKNTN
ncbi:MAG: RNA-guided pseudouridylation complex pseudouridine synthase subunit Cbf5 [Nanoarchaeota archaeon]|nr:RNA-guided pseudouridylation complex pseudouridine synthase subunit Cbf5 [Nanoarchaeota archaeon]